HGHPRARHRRVRPAHHLVRRRTGRKRRPPRGGCGMIWNAFTLALGAIGRNLVRSGLTMLGIVIGVAAVITMVTVGNGATAAVTDSIAGLGTNMLIVAPGQRAGGGGFGGGGVSPFQNGDAEAIRDQVSSISAVAPVSTRSVVAIAGNESWRVNVAGVD